MKFQATEITNLNSCKINNPKISTNLSQIILNKKDFFNKVFLNKIISNKSVVMTKISPITIQTPKETKLLLDPLTIQLKNK
jgi:hypothetical protein